MPRKRMPPGTSKKDIKSKITRDFLDAVRAAGLSISMGSAGSNITAAIDRGPVRVFIAGWTEIEVGSYQERVAGIATRHHMTHLDSEWGDWLSTAHFGATRSFVPDEVWVAKEQARRTNQ